MLGSYTLPDLLTAWLHQRRERRLAEADAWERTAMTAHLLALATRNSPEAVRALTGQMSSLHQTVVRLRRPEVPITRARSLTETQRLMIYGPDALTDGGEGG